MRELLLFPFLFLFVGLLAACDEDDPAAASEDDGGPDMGMADMSHGDMAMGDMPMGTVHEGTEAETDDGHFYVTWEWDSESDPAVGDVFSIVVSVYDVDQTELQATAELTFEGSMPTMGHGMDEDPVITPNGDGTFAVTNIAFNMAGQWQFDFVVTVGMMTDTVSFRVDCCG